MPAPPLPRLGALAALLAALPAAGCSEAPTVSECVPGVGDCETPSEPDEVVAGVNLTALFAAPSPAEVEAAEALRPTAPTPGEVEVTAVGGGPGGGRRFLLTLRDGPEAVAHALAWVPGAPGTATPLPVVVVLPDGEDGADADALLASGPAAGLADRAVVLVVAYRGEPLRFGDTAAASSAAPDPYRADVPDLLALAGALAEVPRADPARLGAVGVGRGGTVALLAARAGPALRSVVTLGAPADLLAESFRDDVRVRLRNGTVATPPPAFGALVAPALDLREGRLGVGEARARLLALSPAYGAAPLPAVLALHAVGDDVVGEDHLVRLGAALERPDGTRRFVQRVEGATHAGLPSDPRAQGDAAAFLLDTL